jgi:hypothetical protein
MRVSASGRYSASVHFCLHQPADVLKRPASRPAGKVRRMTNARTMPQPGNGGDWHDVRVDREAALLGHRNGRNRARDNQRWVIPTTRDAAAGFGEK